MPSSLKDTERVGDVTAERGRDRGRDDGEKELDSREGDERGDTIGFIGIGTGDVEVDIGDPQKLKRRRIPLFCFCTTVGSGIDSDTVSGADSGSIKMRESDI